MAGKRGWPAQPRRPAYPTRRATGAAPVATSEWAFINNSRPSYSGVMGLLPCGFTSREFYLRPDGAIRWILIDILILDLDPRQGRLYETQGRSLGSEAPLRSADFLASIPFLFKLPERVGRGGGQYADRDDAGFKLLAGVPAPPGPLWRYPRCPSVVQGA